jgi:hypothetical protein
VRPSGSGRAYKETGFWVKAVRNAGTSNKKTGLFYVSCKKTAFGCDLSISTIVRECAIWDSTPRQDFTCKELFVQVILNQQFQIQTPKMNPCDKTIS